jgi:hypothetical protein
MILLNIVPREETRTVFNFIRRTDGNCPPEEGKPACRLPAGRQAPSEETRPAPTLHPATSC